MTHDPNAPEPLVSSADDAELRALLGAGRDELPTRAQLDGLASKLGPILGPGGPGGGHGGAAAVAKKGVGVVIAKAVGLAALTIVIGTGAVHAVRSRTVSDAMPTTRATSATIAAAPASAAVPDEPPAPAPSSAPVAVPQSVIARAAAPRSTSSAAVTVGDPNDDVTLVQNAQSALPTDPARTLALCAEHARRFPNGLMAQEREVLAIGALAKTGRLGDARARANKFAATYPTSTHLPRIHAVLGDAP